MRCEHILKSDQKFCTFPMQSTADFISIHSMAVMCNRMLCTPLENKGSRIIVDGVMSNGMRAFNKRAFHCRIPPIFFCYRQIENARANGSDEIFVVRCFVKPDVLLHLPLNALCRYRWPTNSDWTHCLTFSNSKYLIKNKRIELSVQTILLPIRLQIICN